MGTTKITCFITIFVIFVSKGNCQLSGMFGGMPSGMMGMGPGMFGGMPSGMMGSAMMGGMLPDSNSPMMALAMGSIELNPTEIMILNQLVQTIVGPKGTVNPALMVLYSTDGGLPINAARMIPYITIMQGMAKDLEISVPGVNGKATRQQIDNYIFQKSLMWMQQRNMAGAFIENVGMYLMSNAMNNPSPSQPASVPSTPDVSSALATARAAAAARAALAKFAAGQKDNSSAASTAVKPAAAVAAKPAVPSATSGSLSPAQLAVMARLMSGSSGSAGSSMPAGMIGMMVPSSGMSMPFGFGSGGSGSGSSLGLNSMMAMGGMEMMGM